MGSRVRVPYAPQIRKQKRFLFCASIPSHPRPKGQGYSDKALRWQTVLRSKSIYGPYEGRRVLEQGVTDVNGPHQGALVDTPDGEWWFYHFQSMDPQGRVLHLQPVRWMPDGFPMIGQDLDGNGVGEPMKVVPMPRTGKH